MEYQSKQTGVELKYSIDELVPKRVYLDPKRLKQILFNLVGNSLKFTIKGQISVKVSLSRGKSPKPPPASNEKIDLN